MASVEEIRAKLKEAAAKREGNSTPRSNSGGDNASYAFWNIPVGTSATVRFVPDKDPSNAFFWRAREIIKLPFQGVVGGEYPTNKPVTVQVPCVDMFDGMQCPIIQTIKPWWKDEDKKDLARTYYKKKSYIFQGFVVNSPFVEENVPENPIRRFVLNPSLYEIVANSLMSGEIEDLPTDYQLGIDFRISKTQKGEYANYQTSQWSRKTRSLGETELLAIEQHGLWDLKEALGRVPDADEMDAIKALFEASLAGEPFDAASFGKYYRPWGERSDNGGGGDTDTTARTPAKASPAAEIAESAYEDESSPASAPTPSGSSSALDILERIKSRSR